MSQPPSVMGRLFVVATPIGHLGDMTYRAVEVLKKVDWIAAEDTRRTGILLKHYQIQKPMMVYHKHNESMQAERLVARLCLGEQGALLTDAGTPALQDPGQRLVWACHQARVAVSVVPGACAATAAISGSGVVDGPFLFLGFVSADRRQACFQELGSCQAALIFYEAPHRVADFLHAAVKHLGSDRTVVIARELTKAFEQFYHGTLASALEDLGHRIALRGEFVIILPCAEQKKGSSVCSLAVRRVLAALMHTLPFGEAVRLTAQACGLPKNQVYRAGLEEKL